MFKFDLERHLQFYVSVTYNKPGSHCFREIRTSTSTTCRNLDNKAKNNVGLSTYLLVRFHYIFGIPLSLPLLFKFLMLVLITWPRMLPSLGFGSASSVFFRCPT